MQLGHKFRGSGLLLMVIAVALTKIAQAIIPELNLQLSKANKEVISIPSKREISKILTRLASSNSTIELTNNQVDATIREDLRTANRTKRENCISDKCETSFRVDQLESHLRKPRSKKTASDVSNTESGVNAARYTFNGK